MRGERREMLQKLCLAFRSKLIDLLYSIQTGHLGGLLSCAKIPTALYCELMDVDSMNPEREDRDHLILPRGYGTPTLYLILAHKGFFPMDELKNLRQTGNTFQSHSRVHKTPEAELSIDPPGLGLSTGLGVALGARFKGYDSYTYVVMGDGEIREGCIWEVVMPAFKFRADHLISIPDSNGAQLDGTLEGIVSMGGIRAKWEASRWNAIPCDDHDVEGICRAVEEVKVMTDKPSLMLVKTVKGKGVPLMEGRNIRHEKATGDQDYVQAKAGLGGER